MKQNKKDLEEAIDLLIKTFNITTKDNPKGIAVSLVTMNNLCKFELVEYNKLEGIHYYKGIPILHDVKLENDMCYLA